MDHIMDHKNEMKILPEATHLNVIRPLLIDSGKSHVYKEPNRSTTLQQPTCNYINRDAMSLSFDWFMVYKSQSFDTMKKTAEWL